MSLFSELKRRNVIRIAGIYAVVAWILMQVAGTLEASLKLPEWFDSVITSALMIGFPIALLLAWAFEMTPEGMRRTEELKEGETVSSSKLDALILVGIIGVLGLGVWQQLGDKQLDSQLHTNDNTQSVIPAKAGIQSLDPEINNNSIAVLPFVNMSSDKEQEYFSDGLTDTILHKLVQIPELQVAARTSSFKFKGLNEDMRVIAEKLSVANVLEGSVQRQGNKVRITAQLIKGSNGTHLWSKIFEETLDDIFRVQDEIANGVASAMLATLNVEPVQKTEIGSTKNLLAYEAYLKGINALRQGVPEMVVTAVTQLELAVEIDPDYALAWAALTYAYDDTAKLGSATWESTLILKKKSAKMAVKKAPNLAAAHLAYAFAFMSDGINIQQESIEKAIKLEPNNAEALAALASLKFQFNQYREALILTQNALLLNPLDNDLKMGFASIQFYLGNAELAVNTANRLVKNNPEDLNLKLGYNNLLAEAGRNIEWARINYSVLQSHPDSLAFLFDSFYMRLYFGDTQQANEFLKRIEKLSPNRALDDRAYFCLVTGNRECYKKYATNYIALLRKSDKKRVTDLYEGIYWLENGDPKKAIALLKPYISSEKNIINWHDISYSISLAHAYAMNGDQLSSNRILKSFEKEIQKAIENGLWPQLTEPLLFQIAAVRGDSKLAAERLAIAIDNKIMPIYSDLQYLTIYDSVRDAPGFQEQINKVKAYEKRVREEIIAEGIW